VQTLPAFSAYGGASTSRTAQEATEVNECRFPPLWGYNTVVGHGAVRTSSVYNLASLTAYNKNRNKIISGYKKPF
jgi:hypothetical protein